jgi:acyl carrier protein phosphodiesterase
MNYLAHTALSKATPMSLIGNLLGDFMKGVNNQTLYPEIREGLDNHRRVDTLTDQHPDVVNLKPMFQEHTRRFAGVAIDIYFDYLLCKHWDSFYALPLTGFIEQTYALLEGSRHLVPSETMRFALGRMTSQNWFAAYRDEDMIFKVIERAASRIRYPNSFTESTIDIQKNRATIERGFLNLYPELMELAGQQLKHKFEPPQSHQQIL